MLVGAADVRTLRPHSPAYDQLQLRQVSGESWTDHWCHHIVSWVPVITATSPTVLRPLHKTTCVSQHPQLRTGGFLQWCKCYTPFTRYNRLYNRLDNWQYCVNKHPDWQPVWQLCWTNSHCSFNRLLNRVVQPVWQPAVYTIQPVAKPVVKWVWQPIECLYTWYNQLSNRFDNRLYRVSGASEWLVRWNGELLWGYLEQFYCHVPTFPCWWQL